MGKKGLLITAIILGLIIAIAGLSGAVLAFTDGVPKLKQAAKGVQKTEDDENISAEAVTLNNEYDTVTINNGKAGLNNNSQKMDETKDNTEEDENADSAEDQEDEDNSETEIEEEPETKPKKSTKNSYLWADSSKKKLTESSAFDIIEKVENKGYTMPGDRSVARMIINELYAKHGAKFKDKEVQKFFNSKSWYKKIKKKVSTDKAFSKMSGLEKKNIEILDKIDKEYY